MIKIIKMKKVVFFVIFLIVICFIFYYKNYISGNNIIKNREEKELYKILCNLENYEANIEVKIKSNKTEKIYHLYQEVKKGYSMQELIDDSDFSGTKIIFESNTLKIENEKINFQKQYGDYVDIFNNSLFLDTFAKEYLNDKNVKKYYETDKEKIIEINLTNNANTYIKNKILYLNKENLLPIRLEIKDNAKNEVICIKYNNIEIK